MRTKTPKTGEIWEFRLKTRYNPTFAKVVIKDVVEEVFGINKYVWVEFLNMVGMLHNLPVKEFNREFKKMK